MAEISKRRWKPEAETEAVEKERAAACYLHALEGVGEQTLRTLKFRLGALWNFFEGEPRHWQPFVKGKQRSLLETRLHQEAEALNYYRGLKARGIGVLLADDPAYPVLLREINKPPFILYWQGDLSLLHRPALGVVGCRDCTEYGSEQAFSLSAQAAYCGVVIVSGMARGIDTAAHWGALRVKDGATIAVLGNGFNHVFPPANEALMGLIAEKGLLLTEFAPETQPFPGNFPRRNRIISGLCQGVLVVEARRKSGSLITANYAMEQGREVYAVPGPLTDDSSEGANRLLQDGAKLVVTAGDILADYAVRIRQDLEEMLRTLPKYEPEAAEKTRKNASPSAKKNLRSKPRTMPAGQSTEALPENAPAAPEITKNEIAIEAGAPAPQVEDPILTALQQGSRHINDLLEETGLPPGDVMTRLLTLEIDGKIHSLPGNFYKLQE